MPDFGPSALVCVKQLPPENFVLAYERAMAHGERLADSHPFRSATYEAARSLAANRDHATRLGECIGS